MLSHSHPLSHTLSPSVSLSLTHTHTHTLSLPLSHSLPLSLSPSHSISHPLAPSLTPLTHPPSPSLSPLSRYSEVTSLLDGSLAMADRHTSLLVTAHSDAEAKDNKPNEPTLTPLKDDTALGDTTLATKPTTHTASSAASPPDLLDRGEGKDAASGAGEREFELWLVGRVGRAMAAPWRDDVYLAPLSHRCLKLTLQVRSGLGNRVSERRLGSPVDSAPHSTRRPLLVLDLTLPPPLQHAPPRVGRRIHTPLCLALRLAPNHSASLPSLPHAPSPSPCKRARAIIMDHRPLPPSLPPPLPSGYWAIYSVG